MNESSRIVEESRENVGAGVMGRNMFGPIGGGPWGDENWKGWWGDEPPSHYPVFVLTHHPREPVEMEGGTTYHFVTDGIELALEQAKEAAGGKDVMLWGGAQVAQQYLAAGLLDELELHVVPLLLGDGARLFDDLGDADVQLGRSGPSRRPASPTSGTGSDSVEALSASKTRVSWASTTAWTRSRSLSFWSVVLAILILTLFV